MSWFRRQKPQEANPLIGVWKIDTSDTASVEALGDVTIEFDKAGNLNYLIKSEGKVEAILMTYRVEGTTIISDQPSHPNPQRTEFVLTGDGALILSFDGEPSRFLPAEGL